MTEPLARLTLSSPVGPLTVTVRAGAICALRFDIGGPDASDHPVLQEAARQISRYFARQLTLFDLPLDLRGTAFQQRVWQALQNIPAGTTATYADIARAIGAPRAVRAVAQACAANPLAVAIPCHRVVRTDGGLSGYRWGIERKRELLDREADTPGSATGG